MGFCNFHMFRYRVGSVRWGGSDHSNHVIQVPFIFKVLELCDEGSKISLRPISCGKIWQESIGEVKIYIRTWEPCENQARKVGNSPFGSVFDCFSTLNPGKYHISTGSVQVAIAASCHPLNLPTTYIIHKSLVRIDWWSRNGPSGSGIPPKSDENTLVGSEISPKNRKKNKKTKFLISGLYCIPVASVIILLSLLISKTNFRNTQCSIWDQNRGCWIRNYQFFEPKSLEIPQNLHVTFMWRLRYRTIHKTCLRPT